MRQQAPTAELSPDVGTPVDLQRSLRNYQRSITDYFARLDLTTPTVEAFGLSTGTTAGGLAAWQNRTNCDVIVTEFVLDVRNATVIFNMDFGSANDAVTASTNLMNGLLMNGAGFYVSTAATNPVLIAADKFITGSSNGGAPTGTFVGEAYVRYLIRQPIT